VLLVRVDWARVLARHGSKTDSSAPSRVLPPVDTKQEVITMTRDPFRKREEAMRPVREAGGGEAEGFEEAEEMLEEQAEDAEHTTALDGFPEEVESDRSGAEYGEPDEPIQSDS
jgi:hypothetical protein